MCLVHVCSIKVFEQKSCACVRTYLNIFVIALIHWGSKALCTESNSMVVQFNVKVTHANKTFASWRHLTVRDENHLHGIILVHIKTRKHFQVARYRIFLNHQLEIWDVPFGVCSLCALSPVCCSSCNQGINFPYCINTVSEQRI